MVSARIRVFVAATVLQLCAAIDPAAIYDAGYGNGSSILLGIGNGDAGQSGLIEGRPASATLPKLRTDISYHSPCQCVH